MRGKYSGGNEKTPCGSLQRGLLLLHEFLYSSRCQFVRSFVLRVAAYMRGAKNNSVCPFRMNFGPS